MSSSLTVGAAAQQTQCCGLLLSELDFRPIILPMAKEITATTTFCHFAVVGTRSNRTDRKACFRAVYSDHDTQRLFHSL